MAHPVADTFAQAAALVSGDACRRGNCLHLDGAEIVYTGDLHGHRQNLARIIAAADLGGHPDRRLVLQELIHGGPTDAQGRDRSVEVLLRAARLKIAQPQRVFFLLGNHDVAEITASEITKDGRGACKSFQEGLEALFDDAAGEVAAAVRAFLRALPLAARCRNGAFLSHSLPAPARMGLVDWTIFDRPYRDDDFHRGGTLYEWTWGRGQTAEQLQDLRVRLGVDLFLVGHQPMETGWSLAQERLLVLDSQHAQGVILIFRADQPVPRDHIATLIKPIATL